MFFIIVITLLLSYDTCEAQILTHHSHGAFYCIYTHNHWSCPFIHIKHCTFAPFSILMRWHHLQSYISLQRLDFFFWLVWKYKSGCGNIISLLIFHTSFYKTPPKLSEHLACNIYRWMKLMQNYHIPYRSIIPFTTLNW